MSQPVTILVVGDPHFQSKSIKETNIMEDNLLEMIDTNTKIDMAVILGDVHHKHSQMDIMNNMRVTKFLINIANKVPTYVLVGNHDIANNEQFLPEAHSLYSLKFCPSLTIVDKPMKVLFEDVSISMIPYLPVDRMYEGLDMIEGWKESDIIFCHQEVRGVKLSKTNVSECNDTWSPDLPLLVCGHVHTYQLIANNLLYVGTPYSQNFSELDRKTVSILTHNKSSDELKAWSESRMDLDIPGRLQISCSVDELDIDPQVTELIDTDHPPGTKLKLKIRGTSDQLKGVTKLPIIHELKKSYDLSIQKMDLDVFKPLQYEDTESVEEGFESYLRNLNMSHLVPIFRKYTNPPTE